MNERKNAIQSTADLIKQKKEQIISKYPVKGWYCGVAGKTTACSTSIPYGHRFKSWLLHF